MLVRNSLVVRVNSPEILNREKDSSLGIFVFEMCKKDHFIDSKCIPDL